MLHLVGLKWVTQVQHVIFFIKVFIISLYFWSTSHVLHTMLFSLSLIRDWCLFFCFFKIIFFFFDDSFILWLTSSSLTLLFICSNWPFFRLDLIRIHLTNDKWYMIIIRYWLPNSFGLSMYFRLYLNSVFNSQEKEIAIVYKSSRQG